MKVLLSAYACEPGRGSEPDVGFQAMLTVAERHDVWVITRRNNVAPLQRFLEDDPRGDRITVHGVDLDGLTKRLKRTNHFGATWYYHRWQGVAAKLAKELDRSVGFDAVFHVTFAAYWMKVGAAAVNKPLLLGPVGGAVETPFRLLPELGWRGILEEFARSFGRRIWFRLPGVRVAARRASHILTNNEETARRLAGVARSGISILPNPTAIRVAPSVPPYGDSKDIAFVGRLIPWKALPLAVRVIRNVRTPGARLLVFGDGPDRQRAQKRISKWKLDERVVFFGQVDRSEVLDHLGKCGAMIHPALHEEGGNVIAEALAMNVPVICLDRGGPPITLSLFPHIPSHAISPQGPRATARAMAEAVDLVLQHPVPRSTSSGSPRIQFKEEVLMRLESVAKLDSRAQNRKTG